MMVQIGKARNTTIESINKLSILCFSSIYISSFSSVCIKIQLSKLSRNQNLFMMQTLIRSKLDLVHIVLKLYRYKELVSDNLLLTTERMSCASPFSYIGGPTFASRITCRTEFDIN